MRRGELKHELGEVVLVLVLVLELKLHNVHFADKFSGANLTRLRTTCLQSAPSGVSTPMSTERYQSTPKQSLQGEGYLANLWLTLEGVGEVLILFWST